MIKIKEKVQKNPLTAKFYVLLSKMKKSVITEKQKNSFEKSSLQLMKDIQETLSECEVITKFFFMFGTLLGAYRDKKLIRNDMDIDVGVYLSTTASVEDFRRYMKMHGYKLIHYYLIESGDIIQDSYEKKSIKVDIAYIFESDSHDYCYLMYDAEPGKENVLQFQFKKIKRTRMYLFSGLSISIPENPDVYLSDTYGDDWVIPNPNYKYWENPNAKKMDLRADIEHYGEE